MPEYKWYEIECVLCHREYTTYWREQVPSKGICPLCTHGRNRKLIEKLKKLHKVDESSPKIKERW